MARKLGPALSSTYVSFLDNVALNTGKKVMTWSHIIILEL